MNLDLSILDALNSLTGQGRIPDLLIIFFANYLVYVFAIIAVLYWFWHSAKFVARKAVTLAAISFILARLIVTELIRYLYFRSRPEIVHPIINMTPKQSESAFPSGHATGMFSIAMAIYFYNKKLGWLLLVMSVITAIARVSIGVHYPSDVAAGAIIGILTAWITEKTLFRKIDNFVRKLSDFSDRIFKL